ncbi:hypothetical protein HG535_0F01320 [Zygotorulaspora mrakii]|uniref:NADP-dependent oxidoreductase domain-containing protein n=1 Tax=Zygotorulaspora mrakii TaxID=42260 RepID=A0A7H9B4K5_ZYGMR|nr:uncharacterized protein HG535_0F01320 [Zygotorulaspora mrakii]QLG73621.1 hypothetical protein HG535_0F01320 [Zygotorulaspora mrakii]
MSSSSPEIKMLRSELSKIPIGYGLMSFTWRAEPIPQEQAFPALKRGVEMAVKNGHKAFFNVGEFYGPDWSNLKLVRAFFEKYPALRESVIISCKGGMNNQTLSPKGRYDDVVSSVEKCVSEIGGPIDLFEVARLDKSICTGGAVYPYESFKALAAMVENGAIGGISLSEVTAEEIRAIAKDWHNYLVAVEIELSMFSPQVLTNGVAKTNSDFGLVTVAYSPLGRGLLTGQVKSTSDIPKGDFRSLLVRFSDDSLKKNLVLVEFLKEEIVAKRPADNPITLVEVSLGWVRHWNSRSEYANTHFLPIPSGSSVSKVEENMNEVKTVITKAEFQKITDFLKNFETTGDRYEVAH